MSYIDFEQYINLYGPIPEADFYRLSWEASRKIDVATTGVDGVKKLHVAFPTDENDAEAVKRCAGALIDALYRIKQAGNIASGYVETANGLHGKVISSVSAGNESISYAVGSATTMYDKALADKSEQDKLISDIVRDYLSGVTDANGVNLLFMGVYPYKE